MLIPDNNRHSYTIRTLLCMCFPVSIAPFLWSSNLHTLFAIAFPNVSHEWLITSDTKLLTIDYQQKGQGGWQDVLGRFASGGGILYDLGSNAGTRR